MLSGHLGVYTTLQVLGQGRVMARDSAVRSFDYLTTAYIHVVLARRCGNHLSGISTTKLL